MLSGRRPSLVLFYEAAGFLAIMALSWLNELAGLPHLLLGGPAERPEIRESVMESLVILAVAVPILLLTRQLVSRLFYLEKFLKICAWCKRVDAGNRWVPMDEYLAAGYGQKTTHGMCPDCYAKATGKPR